MSRDCHARFRAALGAFACNPDAFLGTREGAWFVRELRAGPVRRVQAHGRALDYPYTADEAVQLVFDFLLRDKQRICHLAAERAADPAAYLAGSLWSIVEEESGRTVLEGVDDVPAQRIFIEGFKPYQDFEDEELPATRLTPLSSVVSLVTTVLTVRAPERLAPAVADTVEWLAHHTPEGGASHRRFDRGHALQRGDTAPLQGAQFDAVLTMVWGGRPTPVETSLAYAFLHDRHFDPVSSRTHQRALGTFQQRMHSTARV